jgi:hypothetical protein
MQQKLKECGFDGSNRVVFIESQKRKEKRNGEHVEIPAKIKVMCLDCGVTSTTIGIEDAGSTEKAKEVLARLWNRQASESFYRALRRTAANVISSMGSAFPVHI